MILKSSDAAQVGMPDNRFRNIRAWVRLALLLACAAPAPHALAAEGGVYVAGQGTSVDQALQQALADNGGKSIDRFWVIVSGADVRQVTKGEANKDVLAWVRRVRERGGIVYVCRADLGRHNIKEDELLDGVIEIYGYGKKDWSGLLPARKEGIVLPKNMRQSQLILKTCGEDGNPGS